MSRIAWHFLGIAMFGGAWLAIAVQWPGLDPAWPQYMATTIGGSLLRELGVAALPGKPLADARGSGGRADGGGEA